MEHPRVFHHELLAQLILLKNLSRQAWLMFNHDRFVFEDLSDTLHVHRGYRAAEVVEGKQDLSWTLSEA